MSQKREPVPVQEAIEWYKWLGTWAKVREVIRRKDGSLFTYSGIQGAVRRYDRRAA